MYFSHFLGAKYPQIMGANNAWVFTIIAVVHVTSMLSLVIKQCQEELMY